MLLVLCAGGMTSNAPAAAGASAPDFALKDISGKKVSLSGYRGKVVLLNFWATWCGSCKAEMPSLNNLYLELGSKGLAVLAVTIDTSEDTVRSFVADRKLAFTVLMDKEKEVYFDSYAVMGLPTTFLIDKKGNIVEKIIGEREWDAPQMKEKILRLITGR